MDWYISRLIFQIVTGEGNHTAQFDEQIVMVSSLNIAEAYEKAKRFGIRKAISFFNNKGEQVEWVFIGVCEIRKTKLGDGEEIYSTITESDMPERFKRLVKLKTTDIEAKVVGTNVDAD